MLHDTIDLEASALGSRELALTDDLELGQLAVTRFAALVLEQGIPHVAEARWPTAATSIDELLPLALATVQGDRLQAGVLDLESALGEPCLAAVTLSDGMSFVRLAAGERRLLADGEAWLRSVLAPVEPTADRIVPVSFWSYGSAGALSIVRRVAVPAWEQIHGNYPPSVSARLADLMSASSRLSERGRLLLWHGDPGTGKTYALRALAWEWRKWCRLHYIADPETFFGRHADYMLDVLVGEEDDDGEGWRLVILEDTGELLAADAKERTGQGLSRLLNVVDGLLGQGLRMLVLVTTNEPLKRLHPAVARPGRCAAKIEFRAFSAEEAAAWLAARCLPVVERGATLAALLGHPEQREDSPPVGFGR